MHSSDKKHRRESIEFPYINYPWHGFAKNWASPVLMDELVEGLSSIDNFCKSVLDNEMPAFVRAQVGSQIQLRETVLGAKSRALNHIPRAAIAHWRMGQRLRAYCEACDELQLEYDLRMPAHVASTMPGHLVADRINALVDLLREKLSSRKWKQRDLHVQLTCLQNYRHTRKLVNSSFRRFEQIKIERLDLGYQPEQGEPPRVSWRPVGLSQASTVEG